MTKGYDMATAVKVEGGYQANCVICGKLGIYGWEDDALDEAAEHDGKHGYDDRDDDE